MKALEMQKDGGNIVCILNAETLKNPFTNLRKVLKGKLEQYNAAIEYLEEAFLDSEHPTTVEVAVVKVSIPAKSHDSSILESLKSKTYDEGDFCSRNLAVKDLVRSIVKNYEVEVEAGIRLIQEYLAMQPYLMDSLDMDDAYKKPIIRMKIGEKDEISVNSFVRSVRKKYWSRLFNDRRFTANMTSNLRDEYRSMVHELADYDFSFYNIKTIQDMTSPSTTSRRSRKKCHGTFPLALRSVSSNCLMSFPISTPIAMNSQRTFITITDGRPTRRGLSTKR